MVLGNGFRRRRALGRLRMRAAAGVLLAAVAFATPARAGDPFDNPAFNLTAEDRALLGRAAEPIIMSQHEPVGTRAVWFNPHTNAGGVVTFRRGVADSATPCRLIAYDLTVPPAIRTHTYLVKWCHRADGAWTPTG